MRVVGCLLGLSACTLWGELSPPENIEPRPTAGQDSAESDLELPEEPKERPPETEALLRWPYLQEVDSDGLSVIVGVSDEGQQVEVELARDDDRWTVEAEGDILAGVTPTMRLLRARFDGLEAGTTYSYRVMVDGVEVIGGFSAMTRPADEAAPVRFLVLGDFGSGRQAQRDLRDVMLQHLDGVQFWLTTGDNAYYGGTAQSFQDNVFKVYQEILAEVPMLPTPGNHDYQSYDLQPYLDSFFLPEQGPDAWSHERFWRVDWGPLRLFGLDSVDSMFKLTREPGDDQLDWIEEQDALPGPPWKLAAFHYPAYSAQPNRTPDYLVKLHLEPLLEALAFPLVLTGHNHMYERFVPIREGKADPTGITWIVSGGGGQGLYPTGKDPLHAYVEEAYHFMIFDVDACTLQGRAIDIKGNVIDDWTQSICP